jgi:hypothetical protein
LGEGEGVVQVFEKIDVVFLLYMFVSSVALTLLNQMVKDLAARLEALEKKQESFSVGGILHRIGGSNVLVDETMGAPKKGC